MQGRPDGLVAFMAEATSLFLEATQNLKKRRVLKPIERELEKALQGAFRQQGKLFLEQFAELEPWFPKLEEAALPADISPAQIEAIWREVMGATFYLFEDSTRKGILKALQAGGYSAWADLELAAFFKLEAHPDALAYAQYKSAELVTQINQTTMKYIRTQITHAMDEGWSYNKTAKMISDRFEEFAIGKPQLHIQSRAHLVAVTEVGEGYMQGRWAVGEGQIAMGIPMEKYWANVGDDRVSDGCLANTAVGWIDYHAYFPSGHLRPLRFPGCRCDMHIRRKGA